ncbi:RNA polymerase sigma factor SigJ [Pseudactinotalea suaedae]
MSSMMTGSAAGEGLAVQFDRHRAYLATVAYRMLGSHADAEDAVQEAWLRLARTDVSDVEDLRAWLTRVVSRISLDQLRARSRRPEDPLEALPDVEAPAPGPASRAETAERVSYALMIVLDQLEPDERLAYVLHDVFGLPFREVAGVVDRTPAAARKLASRARERLRGGGRTSRGDATRRQQRAVVDAFLEAAGAGNLEALIGVLHPEVEFRIDEGPSGIRIVRGAPQVANGATRFRQGATRYAFEVVDLGDQLGVLSSQNGEPSSLLLITSEGDRIVAMEARLLR